MSVTRHHTEWVSLLEVSGPFLSMLVLLRVFPQGLDAHDAAVSHQLRLAVEEWHDNQLGLRADPAIHHAWVRFVLQTVLDLPATVLLEHQALPEALKATVAEHGETLRPTFAIQHPDRDSVPRLLGMVVPRTQDLEKSLAGQRWKASPATRMLELLRATDIPLGLLTNGEHWMLVSAPKGETTSCVSWYAELWLDEPLTLRAFRTLLGVRRFFGVPDSETLPALLRESTAHQQEVTDQLGAQVRAAVELLVQSLDRIDKDQGRTLLRNIREPRLYESALTVMMRLVFLFSADERGLLLLGDALYDQFYSVSTLRAQLREMADQHGEEILERRFDAWSRLLAMFRAVYGGVEHEALRLPAYGGQLFDPDRFAFLEGRARATTWREHPAQPLAIDNRTVLHLLESLQILRVRVPGGGYEPRRLSFRALDIEQIGHVYEGLLDHTAVRAKTAMVGFVGVMGSDPEVALDALEAARAAGSDALLELLKATTGRSPTSLQRDLDRQPDLLTLGALRSACDNDPALLERVLPFAGLLRADSFGRPVIISAGSVYVTAGSDRRATGTHYTPRVLTEGMVKHALDPLLYNGPASGIVEEQWQLRSPQQILAIKVCDMAMGSGAFLVQACRYMAAHLVEAWEARAARRPSAVLVLPYAQPATGALSEQPLPTDDEERLLAAQRLIAERCLYGVDLNPLAVEIGKLSLWLITLQKYRPFTFLDHALRCGDSLLGVSREQLLSWSFAADAPVQLVSFALPLQRAVEHAQDTRAQLERLTVRDIRDVEQKELLLAEAESALEIVKLGADLLAATALIPKSLRATESHDWLYRFSAIIDAPAHVALSDARICQLQAEVTTVLGARRPFHWQLEFPEIFADPQNPGFTAIIGNPPFQGGKKITGSLGHEYRDYLVEYVGQGKRGHADLCAYFFLRARQLIQQGGKLGLLATNTIAQGDTREVGLDQLVQDETSIVRAIPSQPWPGGAALEVAHLWLYRGNWEGTFILNDNSVSGITPFLTVPGTVTGKPYRLSANADKSFIGSYVLGMGFVLDLDEAQRLIERDQKNKTVLFPYLNGQDLNTNPDQAPSRWVINFFDRSEADSAQYSEPFAIIEERVKPERQRRKPDGDYTLRKPLPHRWWQFGDKRPALYNTIADMQRTLVIAQTSRTLAFSFEPTDIVFSHMVVVITLDSYTHFALLQSNIHLVWVLTYASSLKGDARYIPSDCFETFPFPESLDGLEEIDERYYGYRQHLMVTRQEGLTKTYNRFHSPDERCHDIAGLRDLHVAMDEAVRDAYGWDDLKLDHGFHETKQGLRFTISEAARREVLDRLLCLNHQRYAAEVAAGLHDQPSKKKAKPQGKRTAKQQPPQPNEQLGLL